MPLIQAPFDAVSAVPSTELLVVSLQRSPEPIPEEANGYPIKKTQGHFQHVESNGW